MNIPVSPITLTSEQKQRIASDWIDNLRTDKQTTCRFRVQYPDEMRYCVIGALLNACVENGVGSWVDDMNDGDFGYTHPDSDRPSGWDTGMYIMQEFGLVSDDDWFDNGFGPSVQFSRVDLITMNDSQGITFDQFIPIVSERLEGIFAPE